MADAARPDRRRERSRRTRRHVVEAATRLFVERGYVSTTIEQIAEEAGVAPQTVYYAFGTKTSVLRAVLESRVVGDDEPVPVIERPWVVEVEEATDAATALDALVRGSVDILRRVAPVYEVVQCAAADPEIAALRTQTLLNRRRDQRRLVEVLASGGHLRDGLAIGAAADVVYGVVNEEVFRLLTVDCGWDLDRFRRWLRVTLAQQLC